MLSLCAIIFLIAGAVLYIFPPKKINSFYGYRTASSMSSQERWKFAQQYSALRMVEAGVFLLLFSFLANSVSLSDNITLGINIGAALISVLYMLVRTERALKLKFPN